MIDRLLRWLGMKDDECDLPCITDPYRINRIIKSKYESGNYIILNAHLHHYLFEIDGEQRVLGILEVLSAIKALKTPHP